MRLLAAEWAEQLGVDPMALARAIMEAALAGEFATLAACHGVTMFDDRRLIHSPVKPGRGADPGASRAIDFAIRSGCAWVHRDAAEAFARSTGREYALPHRWWPSMALAPEPTAVTDQGNGSGGRKRDAIAGALRLLFPKGRPTHNLGSVTILVAEHLGQPRASVSLQTLRRACDEVWPRVPNSAKRRQN